MEIFHDSEDYEVYLSLLAKASEKTGTKIINYALLPNGAFFVIQPTTKTIADFLSISQLGYARFYCRKYSKKGHIWQGHPPCETIRDNLFTKAYGAYIENYPVESGLVENPEDWPYSSSAENRFQNGGNGGATRRPKETKLSGTDLAKTTENPGKFIVIGSRYNGTINTVWVPTAQKKRRPPAPLAKHNRPP